MITLGSWDVVFVIKMMFRIRGVDVTGGRCGWV